jgi:type IV pilus assembly protein PilQ
VLKLEVTPQITPDGRVQLVVDVNKDSVGDIVNGVPSINTKHVKTEVMVDNGGTVVIGGIYEESESDQVDRVPVLGELPVIGALFRAKSKSTSSRELLVFLTPRIVHEALTLR